LVILVYGILNPILSLIMNVYYWRTTNDIRAIILFNGISFLLLPLVNYLSGKAMTRFSVKKTFALGYFLNALSPLVLFTRNFNPYFMALLMGVIYAISRGIFYSNRNFLELNLTEDGQRNFYTSLTSLFSESLNLAVPFLAGWFIVSGEKLNLYSVISAYRYLEIFVILLSLEATALLIGMDNHPDKINLQPRILRQVSPRWAVLRKVFVFHGLSNGLSQFIPMLISMILFKSEGVLGSISLLGSLTTMSVLAWWGHSARAEHRTTAVMVGALGMGVGSFALSLSHLPGIMLYKILYSVGSAVFYMGLKPLEFEVIENEGLNTRLDYSYFLDESIFLNIGRVLGISLCFFLAWNSPKAALIIASVITGGLQLMNVYFLRRDRKLMKPVLQPARQAIISKYST
jgi:YQGE family putative transporter